MSYEDYHIEDEIQVKAYDGQLMMRLLKYLGPHKRLMVIATGLLLVSTALSTLIPYLNMQAIDRYIHNPERVALEAALEENASPERQAEVEGAAESDKEALFRLVCAMVALMLLEGFTRYGQLIIVTYVGQKTMLTMRVQIFSHLQDMSLSFLDRNPVGRLLTRVTNDVENIQQTIVTGLVQAIGEILTIFWVVVIMFWLNWRLTLVALSTLPFIFLVSFFFRRFARDAFLEIRKRIARVNTFMQESVGGMRTVQIFRNEERGFARYAKLNADHRDEWFRQVRYFSLYFPAVDFLGSCSIALVVFYGGHQILQGHMIGGGVASIGMIYAYMQWAERMFFPIRSLADKYNLLQAAMASSERIFQLLDTKEDIVNKPDAIVCPRLEGEVEFKNVSFAYEPERWVIKNLDLHIAPGEKVAIVGHTGAGKTTLANLLSRFYDVQQGGVFIDGVDVRDYEKASLRQEIGIVLQDVFLFSGTVDYNIRLGDPDMSDEHVRACAEYVNAASFIEKLPGKYEYDVGERGCNLSTGQRQLLAFARTLAYEPRILVLDEATSSVDTETEALIQDATAKLMEGRTSIVIAHRLSTVQHADRIVVLHHGEIREMGSHQELLTRRGLYYTLYQLQYKDQSTAA